MYKTTKIFDNNSRGASVAEVLLSMAIIAVAAPLVYDQIIKTNTEIYQMSAARDIVALRDTVMNFIRINQDKWPDVVQIKLSDDELADISPIATVAFIDKYAVRGATITDVYMAFDLHSDNISVARVARDIGGDAAIVGDDGIAYGDGWAVSAPDFKAGDLIYRVSYDFEGEDKSKYLHRGTSGEDGLNIMERDLNMGGYGVLDVGGVVADSASIARANITFVEANLLNANAAYFSAGANMDGSAVSIGSLRVTGDVTGFRTISAANMNGSGYTTSGRIIADRATITNSVNVARDLILKSDTSRTVSGFTAINTNSIATPFISADQMVFFENFGLTVSGELLMSTTAPLKIGSWTFPSTTPPRFVEFNLTRAARPSVPDKYEFAPLLRSDWQTFTGGAQ